MIGKGKSISHGVAALEYDLAKEIDGQAVVLYVRKISEVRFHLLHHFRTRTPVKLMPSYFGGCCLLSVPLCLMMMYWWFISPMRCMKSLPSSAQSVSVKLELSSIEGLTSKRRQLFFTFGKSVK